MTASDPHQEAARRSPGHGTWPAGHSRRSLPARRLRRQGRRSTRFQASTGHALHHHATLSSSRVRCLFAKNQGRRREAGFRSVGRLPCRGEVRKISVPSSSPLPAVRALVKLEPLSRRRPLSSIEAGGVEARWRSAHRSSTRAGPFDAVIDVVRSRRLLKQRVLTSSSGAWSSSRPFSPLTSSSSFASSPCCPPSQ